MKKTYLFTSEAVSEGHPDKVCDQISDAVLDACLKLDAQAHVAIECFVAEQKLLIGGEIRFSTPSIQKPDLIKIAKTVLSDIGYTREELGFSVHEVHILDWVQAQSEDINQAVNQQELGAGDQGLMFGYATNETEACMPIAIAIAQQLVRLASIKRKSGEFRYARPDMKSQVTVEYRDGTILLDHIVLSIQHDPDMERVSFETYIRNHIISPVIQSFGYQDVRQISINPSSKFVIGGPKGDTGLTGRKIIVDTYGGSARHGGGAFSGKDPTKVDRSAAYIARYIAKHIVAANIAKRVEVQLAYVIGVADPVSISLFTFDTLQKGYEEADVLAAIKRVFFFKPSQIIDTFSLTKPTFKYQDLAVYGHFGRLDLDLPWERLDRVDALLHALKKRG